MDVSTTPATTAVTLPLARQHHEPGETHECAGDRDDPPVAEAIQQIARDRRLHHAGQPAHREQDAGERGDRHGERHARLGRELLQGHAERRHHHPASGEQADEVHVGGHQQPAVEAAERGEHAEAVAQPRPASPQAALGGRAIPSVQSATPMPAAASGT